MGAVACKHSLLLFSISIEQVFVAIVYKVHCEKNIISRIQSVTMEQHRQSFVFSDRDEKIARSGNHVAIWENDERIEKVKIISIPQYMDKYLYDPFQPDGYGMGLKKANSTKRKVSGEISKRLRNGTVGDVGLDAEFARECEEKHGLGRERTNADVNELQQNALNRFNAFRLFHQSSNAEMLRANFKKSDYSIWADINLNGEAKYLHGSIDVAYWIDENARHVGIINWYVSENIDMEIFTELQTSPFFGTRRTILQKQQCKLHLLSSILETKYDLTVTAYIVHLKNENYDIHVSDDWNSCSCKLNFL